MPQTRRDFIKTSAGCALSLAIGTSPLFLSSCTVAKVLSISAINGKFTIPLAEFGLDKMRLIRAPKSKYDILVVKKGEKDYTALLMECTHRQYELDINAKGINCASHGSAFDLDGKVKTGPATEPLKKYKTAIEGNHLVVFLN